MVWSETSRLNRFGKKEQICWDCSKACGGCSWSDKSFTPVPGWDAEEDTDTRTYNKDIKAYRIFDCPQYERMK